MIFVSWYIYILRCCDGTLYCGKTNNLEKRVLAHSGKIKGGARYTRGRRPVNLVYYEKSESSSTASKREIEIKGMSKIQKQNLIGSFSS